MSFPPKLSISASLDRTSPLYDLLDGTTSDQKTTLILQSLVRGTTVKYAPSEQIFSYNDDLAVEVGGMFSGMIGMAWKFLGANGATIAAVAVPVAVKWIKGMIDQKYGGNKTVKISVTPASVNGASGSATVNISGVKASDIVAVLQGIQGLLDAEKNRNKPPANPPSNLPTPDPLSYQTTNPSVGGAAGEYFPPA